MLPEADGRSVVVVARRLSYLLIGAACVALLTAGIYMIATRHFYEAAAALSGLAIIGIILRLTRRLFPGEKRPILQAALAVVLFEAVFFGTVLDFYDKRPYFDKFNHGLAGAFLAIIGLITFYWFNPEQRIRLSVRPGFVGFYCTGFAILGKVLWEFYEYAGDRILQANMQRWQFGVVYALTDTMLDLAVGLLGSVMISLLIWHKLKKDSQKFYQDFISGFFIV